MARYRLLVILFLCIPVSAFAKESEKRGQVELRRPPGQVLLECSQPGQGWEVVVAAGDVWLVSLEGNAPQFEMRIGAAGAIAGFRELSDGIRPMLAPPFKDEVTDRVIQWTTWSDSVKNRVAGLPEFEWRFNITQAGTFDNQIHPTMRVALDVENRTLDVYAVPQDQWKPQQRSRMQGKLSCLTRYDLSEPGILKLRRIVRVGDVTLNGRRAEKFEQFGLESWTPFRRGETSFDSLALALEEDGKSAWGYRAGTNLPKYPQIRVEKSHGYAVVHASESPADHTAIGMVFGKKQVQAAGDPTNAANVYQLNMMDWENGIAVLPGIWLRDVAAGTLIDQTLYIVPRHHLDQHIARLLKALAESIPAPALIPPGTKLPGDLAPIAAELEANLSMRGERTEHLGGFLIGGDVERPQALPRDRPKVRR
jgi:hypothetical protein